MSTSALLQSLPRARAARVTALRELRRAEGDDQALEEFPVETYASRSLDPIVAWRLWSELHEHPQLSHLSCFVVTDEALVLDDAWERCCERAARTLERLKHRHVPKPVSNEGLEEWLKRADTRAVARRFGIGHAEGPEVHADAMEEQLLDLLDASDEPVRPWPPGRATVRMPDADESQTLILQLYVPHSEQGPAEIAWRFPGVRDEGQARVYLIAAPSWQAPALLGWQFTIDAWVKRAAVLRSWQERYGLETVALGRRSVEAYVPNRPRDYRTLTRAFLELAAFCPDGLQDGEAAVLASVLGHVWNLWWD